MDISPYVKKMGNPHLVVVCIRLRKYVYTHWKKLRNNSSPNFNFWKSEILEALQFWIFDRPLLKALSTYSLNYLSPREIVFVLRRIQYATRE